MGLNVLNRNGGCSKGSTAIIIAWKMKKATDGGYSGWGIMPMHHTNGLCMDFLHKSPLQTSPNGGGLKLSENSEGLQLMTWHFKESAL